MEPQNFNYTTGMEKDEIDELLRQNQNGVLSLSKNGESYAVPITYHYDGSDIYLRLSESENSEKIEFLETTEVATFVVFDVKSPDDAWSIIARGPVSRVPKEGDKPDDELFPLRIFDEPFDEIDIRMWRLETDELTGRRTVRS